MNYVKAAICSVLALTLLGQIGCAMAIYPVTSGSHAILDPSLLESIKQGKAKPRRFVIWASHPAIAGEITTVLQKNKGIIVERSRLDSLFKEQEILLTHTPDDDAKILKVGHLVGADRVVFAEHSITSTVKSEASHSETVYQVSVTVRTVDVESGEVRWNGTAHYPRPINNPEAGLSYLAQAAVARALCLSELGYEWSEIGFWGGGCRKNDRGG